MSENARSENVDPETTAENPIESDYRPDVWPHSSRVVVCGALAFCLVIGAVLEAIRGFTMGDLSSIIYVSLLLAAAAYIARSPFHMV